MSDVFDSLTASTLTAYVPVLAGVHSINPLPEIVMPLGLVFSEIDALDASVVTWYS